MNEIYTGNIDILQIVTNKKINIKSFDLIIKRKFNSDIKINKYLTEWPSLYLIIDENRSFYVGETTTFVERIKQHINDDNDQTNWQKKVSIYLIASNIFNKSVLWDYECFLIRYLSADKTLYNSCLNRNNGHEINNYYQKGIYLDFFNDTIFKQLELNRLVDKTKKELEDSQLFKLSPYLPIDTKQNELLNNIALKNEDRCLVCGMPGSGKTVLLSKLAANFCNENENGNDKYKVAIIEPMKNMQYTMSEVFKIFKYKNMEIISIDKLILNIHKDPNKYDYILIDEIHRIKKYKNIDNSSRPQMIKVFEKVGLNDYSDNDYSYFDALNKVLSNKTKLIGFYDPYQKIREGFMNKDEVFKFFNNKVVDIDEQYRCNGGKEYIDFLKNILFGKDNKNLKFLNNNFEFKIHASVDEFINSFKENKCNKFIRFLGSGDGWSNDGKSISQNIPLSKNYSLHWNDKKISEKGKWITQANNEEIMHGVGCPYTCQGEDLIKGYVIIGPEIDYDFSNNCLIINNKKIYTNANKSNDNEKLLKNFLCNYYILLTRGIEGTHIYICNDNLQKYFKHKFDQLNSLKEDSIN